VPFLYFYIFIFLYFYIFIFLYFYIFIFLYFYIFIFLYFYIFIFLYFYICLISIIHSFYQGKMHNGAHPMVLGTRDFQPSIGHVVQNLKLQSILLSPK